MQPTAPPGWYPDPGNSRQIRWFDGIQWTANVSLAPMAGMGPPAGEHPSSIAHWMLPVGRSWQSIVAGYLGLFSVLLIPAPFAIGFGIWGLNVAKKQGSHGRGRCIFALIAGTAGTLLLLIAIAQG